MIRPDATHSAEVLTAIADGLTRAELRGDVVAAARFRADLGEQLLLRGRVDAAQLHLATARALLSAAGRTADAARVSALLHQTLWMSRGPVASTARRWAA